MMQEVDTAIHWMAVEYRENIYPWSGDREREKDRGKERIETRATPICGCVKWKKEGKEGEEQEGRKEEYLFRRQKQARHPSDAEMI